tara:strand:- start:293 stop:475 length:183 start_codon:yes stop_codon:yes gene_type:complete
MGNTNSKLNSRKVEPTMTVATNYEIPVKNVLKPINNLKKILKEKKSDEIVRVRAFKIEIE